MSDPTDITGKALRRLLDQFSESPKLVAWFSAYLDRLQDLEDAAHPLFAERGIDNATGHRLDGIGQIFKVARGGRTDADYRKALKIEQLVLQSNGTGNTLLAIVEAILETGGTYEFLEYFPKTVYVRPVDFVLDQDPQFVATALERSAPAATTLHFVFGFYPDAQLFTLSSSASSVTSSSLLGLANDAQTTGGRFVNAL